MVVGGFGPLLLLGENKIRRNKIMENMIDQEAISKIAWLKDYCLKHPNNCRGCIFNKIDKENPCFFEGKLPQSWNIDLFKKE